MTTTSERRRRILQMLMERGDVQVSELSPSFRVSTVTIRNDLSFFEEQGLVTRTYGGAYLKDRDAPVSGAQQYPAPDADLAARLGATAAAMVHAGERILIDAGPAMKHLARAIRRVHHLAVMTNGIDIALELANANDIELICTGGILNRKSRAFQGAQAELGLDGYRFDMLFMGADAIGIREGITGIDESEARMKRRMIEAAARCIVVTDSSAFGRVGLHRIAPADRIDTIITDSGLPAKYREVLERNSAEIVIVERGR